MAARTSAETTRLAERKEWHTHHGKWHSRGSGNMMQCNI